MSRWSLMKSACPPNRESQISALVTVALAVVVALFLGPVLSQLPEATLGRGMYTANAQPNERAILSLTAEQQPPVSALVLDVERLTVLSITVLDALEDLDDELAERGVTLHLARLLQSATRVAAQTAWFAEFERAGRVHATVDEALTEAARSAAPPA